MGGNQAAAAKEMMKQDFVWEPKTNTMFSKLIDGKVLATMGMRKKEGTASELHTYAFGLYVINIRLSHILNDKKMKTALATDSTAEPAAKADTPKEVYQAVIDGDYAEMTLCMKIRDSDPTVNKVQKSFTEEVGGAMMKLAGHKDDELLNKVLGSLDENLHIPPGSAIHFTRLPGFTLETRMGFVLVSKVKSELLCKAFFNLYLGDEPIDKNAKEEFGEHLLSLIV